MTSSVKRRRNDSSNCSSVPGRTTEKDDDAAYADGYFNSYDDLSVHDLMLKDKPRVEGYIRAFEANKERLKGKVVLDVGCGTGVLSMLCAKICEPAQIIAVEATESTARIAEALVQHNGLQGVVTVVNRPVEMLDLSAPVDAIVSEWMGFYAFHEAMLDSVLYARDRWLKPDGLLLPDSCRLWAAVVSEDTWKSDNLDHYHNYYSLDFTPFGNALALEAMANPQVQLLSQEEILSDPALVVGVDIHSVTSEELNKIGAKLSMPLKKDGNVAAVSFWFDVGFPNTDLPLSTSPFSPPTHWKQTSIFLGCFAPATKGVQFECQVTLERAGPTSRQYAITVET
ncbi:protein arginine N-methyltransferase, putative [Perkinsus marinus ATCC 50983]|uniref:Protein arginine N-methyltransferase, putative n=1 Tax=Perkinsus marinus (strain ATCC 50983 / TXsc) TaxID=423536 RepID=C5LBN4_PERM5|nr:protein arginine N-methyltransferase, putative [Perkinsus marinus ATCC 50983]EER05855.1 protein arginine N-methyltransferase, putative [Perkinsus marinus ATCC 50983]|eukprot:XP_002774039.1 protein arginine N-methyltransferase, putative [Perkinsus marinus ATCC 50983]